MSVDLHIHSTRSDGTLTPAEIVGRARELGLTVALTDHNTVAGVAEFLEEAERLGVDAVGGIELSTVYGEREIHLLGLFIPPEHYADLEALVRDYRDRKEKSNLELVERLRVGGYVLDYGEIKRKNPDSFVNRALIAAELTELGYTESVSEAFRTLLGEGLGYYVPPERLDFFEAIRFLREIRTVPVWAHPLQYAEEEVVRAILPGAIEAGLLGMEVQHSSYDDGTVLCAKALADEFGLLYSGGSDFHGTVKPDVRLGVGKGNLDIPDSYWKALREASRRIG